MLDAGAFYAGIPFLSSSRYCTTQAVLDEVKHIKRSYNAIGTLLDSGLLQVIDPDNNSIEKAAAAAKNTGDLQKLSRADISVIALALHLGLALVTDDYAVANVSAMLQIPIRSTLGKGIKENRKWINYCSACGKMFGPNSKECRICGNTLRRKYKVIKPKS